MNAYTLVTILALPLFAMGWGAAPAFAAGQEAKVEQSVGQQIVCRKLDDTGSLVKKKKVCLTRQQWVRSQQNNARYAQQLADELRSRPISR